MWLQQLVILSCLSCLLGGTQLVEPTLKYTNGDFHVFVFDNLIHPKLGSIFQTYLVRQSGFTYLYPDPYENDPEIPNSGNLHWRGSLNPSKLIKMKIWKPIREAYKSLPEEIIQGRRYLPYDVSGTMLRRGDFPVPFTGDEDTKDKLFMRIFLTKGMGKHAYSDQSFYDEKNEIFASIYPKAYRIVIWNGNVSTLFRPPSMGYEQGEYSLFLKLSTDTDLFKERVKTYLSRIKQQEDYKKLPFPFKNQVNIIDYEKVNFSEHLIGKYHDRDGNVIAFFDNIFPKEVVDTVRTYYTHYESGLSYNLYDPASTETHDNVNWIMQLKAESIYNTPFLEMIKRMGGYLTNNTEWHPYDVSCNLIQHTHHTRIHEDCVHREFELTFLMYLNPNWNEDMYAETSFYQYDADTFNTLRNIGLRQLETSGKETYDFIAAAIPKFGRIALFRNLVPHSARPPAPNFMAARYTFPVKVAENMRQARAKMLHESLDYKTENNVEDPLYEQLRLANYEPYLQDDTRDWVEKHLKIMRDEIEKTHEKGRIELENTLFPRKEF